MSSSRRPRSACEPPPGPRTRGTGLSAGGGGQMEKLRLKILKKIILSFSFNILSVPKLDQRT